MNATEAKTVADLLAMGGKVPGIYGPTADTRS